MDFSGTYYPIDARYSYGPADNNRAHAFMLSTLWEIPFGRGQKFGKNIAKPLDWIAGGWQANGIMELDQRPSLYAELSGL